MTPMNEVAEDRAERVAPNGGGRVGPVPAAAASGRTEDDPSRGTSSEHTPLVAESISILDSAMELILARVNLEGYRLERRGKALLFKVAGVIAAATVTMLGFVLVSVGGALLLSQPLQSLPAALLAVGGFELLAGLVAVMVISRRSPRHARDAGGIA